MQELQDREDSSRLNKNNGSEGSRGKTLTERGRHRSQQSDSRRLLRPKSERCGSVFEDQNWPASTPGCDVLVPFSGRLSPGTASRQPLICRAARALPAVPLAQHVMKSGSSCVLGLLGSGDARWLGASCSLRLTAVDQDYAKFCQKFVRSIIICTRRRL
jgi:hypothetical protein